MTMTENEKGQEGPGTIIISNREEEPEPNHPDHGVRPWEYPITCPPPGQVTDAGCH